MNFQPWYLVLMLPPLSVALIIVLAKNKDRATKREPFTEPLLRPPGESCRLKLLELDEKIGDIGLQWTLSFVVGLALALMVKAPFNLVVTLILFVSISLWMIFLGRKLWKLLVERWNYDLGFQGERAVGQTLHQLMLKGYRVYHDLPFDSFNIDHVIVGPSGVYAIETKTRRKPKTPGNHKVTFTGSSLIYPMGEEAHGVDQAKRNAKHLSQWLSRAVGESLFVRPVLVLPGWYIERKERGDLFVLNQKEILNFLPDNPATPISNSFIKRIAYQLEQKSAINN